MYGAYRNAGAGAAAPRVAVVGSGIAGLAAAHALRGHAHVTLYEAGAHFGGHANTVEVTLDGVTHGVDTGFLVFNDRTYPGLRRLFAQLRVHVSPSDMSFSVRAGALEWSGTNLDTVFCQRRNLLRPAFWRMLRDLLRFNALATRIAERGEDRALVQPLGDFLDAQGFGPELRDHYLLPMTASIWSCPTGTMLNFPAGTLIRFCHNHGLLRVTQRPQWYTVTGGSREYVRRIVAQLPDARLATPVRHVARDAAGAVVVTDTGAERFEAVVMATHPGQALQLLANPTAEESMLLDAIRYQPNRAVLHTDASVLPRETKAWSAWNHEAGPDGTQVCLHYLLNRLQPLPWSRPVIVTLNPLRAIPREHVLGEFDYEHPVFDAGAIAAQRELASIQGLHHTWYCGAWAGYGFHEDGLVSGEAAADSVLAAFEARRLERAA
ncbi:NAD(P)/FAD-dependent oxidoreductase [Ramlibacter albus]|uniref:FAD-dependent oxidoreductase n=1 Tax=Ramlibacter albus TaxID=2079448 RepID=A0A923M7G6_9BURK|nr:FAD-dependent oxidoreductase [Ramlibacter albus]MBC5765243.1 FAD-dependent oxidoreductase [Ramlibacter albus]